MQPAKPPSPLARHADVLADGHAERARHKAGHARKHDVVELVAAALHAQHQGRHADEAVVGAQHARAQPRRPAAVVLVLVWQLRACAQEKTPSAGVGQGWGHSEACNCLAGFAQPNRARVSFCMVQVLRPAAACPAVSIRISPSRALMHI